jgi:hypothetical protein
MKSEAFTSLRIAAWVSKPHALEGQLLPMVKRADSLEDKPFDTVMHLELGPAEFGNPLHQHLQTANSS